MPAESDGSAFCAADNIAFTPVRVTDIWLATLVLAWHSRVCKGDEWLGGGWLERACAKQRAARVEHRHRSLLERLATKHEGDAALGEVNADVHMQRSRHWPLELDWFGWSTSFRITLDPLSKANVHAARPTAEVGLVVQCYCVEVQPAVSKIDAHTPLDRLAAMAYASAAETKHR